MFVFEGTKFLVLIEKVGSENIQTLQ